MLSEAVVAVYPVVARVEDSELRSTCTNSVEEVSRKL